VQPKTRPKVERAQGLVTTNIGLMLPQVSPGACHIILNYDLLYIYVYLLLVHYVQELFEIIVV